MVDVKMEGSCSADFHLMMNLRLELIQVLEEMCLQDHVYGVSYHLEACVITATNQE